MTRAQTEIPEQIKAVMHPDECDNMRALDGWAVGTVVCHEDGDEVNRIDDAWIELFDGNGRAGEFNGVRFMGVSDGEYMEAYAHGDGHYFEQDDRTGWFVESYTEPELDSVPNPFFRNL